MISTNFLTQKEKERLARNETIMNRYSELKSENPDLSDNRLFNCMAKEFSLCVPGIRKIVIRYQQ